MFLTFSREAGTIKRVKQAGKDVSIHSVFKQTKNN